MHFWDHYINVKLQKNKKNKLSNGSFEILKPLYQYNMAKVSIVQWSQNLIFASRSTVSGIPENSKNTSFSFMFQNIRWTRNVSSGNKKTDSETCHGTFIKWFQNCIKTIGDYFIASLFFPIENFIITRSQFHSTWTILKHWKHYFLI